MKTVTAKFGKMRKAVEWVIYPKSAGDDGLIRLQSDHRCLIINPENRFGFLSRHVANYPTFRDVMVEGREKVQVEQAFIDECLAATPKPGDEVGPGVIIG